MSKITKILDAISGYFFLAGFITGKLKNIPIFVLSTVFSLISLSSYLVGYVTWYVSSFIYPDHPKAQTHWSGFTEFKLQYQLAALLGIIATVICFIAPPLIIPTTWIYSISNTIWLISELHKKNNPHHQDEHYSETRQKNYIRYAFLVTLTTIIAAIGATLSFLIPPAALIIIPIATILGILFTIASLYYFGKSAFITYPPTSQGATYDTLTQTLGRNRYPKPETPSPTQKITPLVIITPTMDDDVMTDTKETTYKNEEEPLIRACP